MYYAVVTGAAEALVEQALSWTGSVRVHTDFSIAEAVMHRRVRGLRQIELKSSSGTEDMMSNALPL